MSRAKTTDVIVHKVVTTQNYVTFTCPHCHMRMETHSGPEVSDLTTRFLCSYCGKEIIANRIVAHKEP